MTDDRAQDDLDAFITRRTAINPKFPQLLEKRELELKEKAQEYFEQLDAAYSKLVPEPLDDQGGLPGEIIPI
jgi:hypothetical protein